MLFFSFKILIVFTLSYKKHIKFFLVLNVDGQKKFNKTRLNIYQYHRKNY